MTANQPINLVLRGDSVEVLRQYPDNFFDSVVTDPPYGLSKEPNIVEVLTKWLAGEDYTHRGGGFMGKTWDSFVPGPTLWREVFRVLKPGGYVLSFAGTRTQDLMTIAIRLAGFEVRDVIEWLYLSGFPKSMDVSKQFDKRAGVEREVVSTRIKKAGDITSGNFKRDGAYPDKEIEITAPATDLARQWDGWGTALKPAHEPIIMARKPLEKTVCYNVEKHGTGALNIDGCRVGDVPPATTQGVQSREGEIYGTGRTVEKRGFVPNEAGRFPANCVTLDSDEWYSKYFNVSPLELSKKASKRDRNSDWRGEQIETPSVHPTVKPVDLMAWLVRLVTPPGGIVLDPFAGSGSTLVAAKREGFSFVGVEMTPEYADIADRRIGNESTEKEAA